MQKSPQAYWTFLHKLAFGIFILFFGFGNAELAAQNTAQADGYFTAGQWKQAAEKYESLLSKKEDVSIRLKLGKCYAALQENALAEANFNKVVFSEGGDPEAKLELGKILRAKGDYAKAITWLIKYAEDGPDSLLAYELASACTKAIHLRNDSLAYSVRRIPGLNSEGSDVSPIPFGQGIAFASARKRGSYNMYLADRSSDGRLDSPKRIKGKINGRYNDGPASLNDAENKFWITRSNFGSLKRPKEKHGLSPLHIVEAKKEKGKWVNGEAVPISSLDFNVVHPAISPDGSTLVFASDMPGSFGGFDLYVSYWQENAWSQPENLGENVNSSDNETYPYFSSAQKLWFASDRIEGFGGKDLYECNWQNGSCTEIRNAGYPLNSAADDFGICFLENSASGFFSTNRAGGEGGDDILEFRRYKTIAATLVNAKTGLPVEAARVEVMDINQKIHYYRTDAHGQFRHSVTVGTDVFVKIFREDYHDLSQNLSIRSVGNDDDLKTTVEMAPIQRYLLTAKVKDKANNQALGDVVVRLIGEKEARGYTNAKGKFDAELSPNTTYRVVFYKEGYVPEIKEIETGEEGKNQVFDFDIAIKKGKFRYLEGRTIDTEREIVLKNAKIRILNQNGLNETEQFVLGEDGMFYKVLRDNQSVSIIASKEKYLPTRIDLLDSLHASDTLLRNIEMVPLMPDVVYKVIYFPYRSASPDQEGMRKLQEVIVLLQDNPRIGIELTAHTDSRGGAAYNKTLSQERADALGKYIAARAISPLRIRTFGKGEDQLYNNCIDGKNCSEELHAQNRRAEIKIVRLEEDGSFPK